MTPSCQVCSGPTNGIWHYGAECCRACASFFHRSVKEKRQYACRGQQNCLISNDDGLRNSCRACRLKKCFEIGMVLDETKERVKKETTRNSTSSEAGIPRLPSLHNSPDGMLTNSYPLQFPMEMTTTSQYATSISMDYKQHQQPQLLGEARIPITMSFMQSLRQFQHGLRALSIVEGISADLAGGEQNFKLLTFEEFKRADKGTSMLIFAIICQHWPQIHELPEETKLKLVKMFVKQFGLMNKAEMTLKAFPDPDSPYAVMIPGGVIDRNQMHLILKDMVGEEYREDFRKSFCQRHFDFVRKRYCPLQVSTLEFAALCGLMFWNTVEKFASDFAPPELYNSKRTALYVELNAIISEQHRNTDAAAVRFGTLLDLLHQLAIFTWEVGEMVEMAKIFMNFPDWWDEIKFPTASTS